MAYKDANGIFHFEAKDITTLTGGAIKGKDYTNNITNGSAITLKDGTNVTKPKNFIDYILENWQLALIGIAAIFVLIKD